MKAHQKISICVPVYNRLELTIRALESIKDQTTKPYEVIVIDDSTENSEPVEEFCKKNKYKYLKNKKKLGLMNNINKTITMAKGDIWCVLHNDDILSPTYIEECNRFINKYPKFNIWVTNGCAVNINDEVIGEYRLFNKDTIVKKKTGIKFLYKKGYYTLLSIIGSTIYRRKFIEKHLFDNSWGNEADLDAALKFLSTEDIKYVDVPIYFTRIHAQQQSSKLKQGNEKLKLYINNRLAIYLKYERIFSQGRLEFPAFAVHMLQLLIKYRLSPMEAVKLLGINGFDKIRLIWELPKYAILQLIQKIRFYLHKKKISLYLIPDTSKKYDHKNENIINAILAIGKKNPQILDIGCWAGRLGEELRRINFACVIDGVDNNEKMLKLALDSGYRKTYLIDLNGGLNIDREYDVVVLGDILEHLSDPKLLLTNIKKNISKNGKAVVSLPNIGFIKYRLLHLFGYWKYTKTGIMDNTHLRFFTLDSMRAMFKECGYNIIFMEGNAAVPDRFFYFRSLARWLPSLFALQVVFVLERK